MLYIALILTFTLFILLGIDKWKLQKKQLLSLIPLLLILLTALRMPNFHSPPVEIKNEVNNVVVQEESITTTNAENKPINLVEKQLTKVIPKESETPYIETKTEVKTNHKFIINPLHIIIEIPLLLQQYLNLEFAY